MRRNPVGFAGMERDIEARVPEAREEILAEMRELERTIGRALTEAERQRIYAAIVSEPDLSVNEAASREGVK